MSNDSTAMPTESPEDRLLRLMEKWGREATAITETMRSIKELSAASTSLQMDVKEKVERLETRCVEFAAQLSALKSHCEQSQKKAGIMGVMEWMMKQAKEQPLAFAMIFMTLVMFLVLATVLGYKLNLQSLLGG